MKIAFTNEKRCENLIRKTRFENEFVENIDKNLNQSNLTSSVYLILFPIWTILSEAVLKKTYQAHRLRPIKIFLKTKETFSFEIKISGINKTVVKVINGLDDDL